MVIGPISEVGHISPSDRVVFKVFGIVVFPALEGEPGDH